MSPTLQLSRQLHALGEGRQIVVYAVQETDQRQAFQTKNHTAFVLWVTIDKTGARWLPVLC